MVNKTDDNLTVEELYKEQLDICKYTFFLNLIFVVLVLLFKFDRSIILGIMAGCITAIAFHLWLFQDLKTAIKLDKEQAVNYANIHSLIRKLLLIIVIVFLVANKWIKVNAVGLIIGLLSLRVVLYLYNLRTVKNK